MKLNSQVAAVKNLPANAADTRDTGSIPGSGRSSGEGNGNPLLYKQYRYQRRKKGTASIREAGEIL